jgi:peptidoglycan/xylan/chitin deacetylase (PgdA/CDA1 family)
MRAIVVYGLGAVVLVGLGVGSLFIGGGQSTSSKPAETAAAAKQGAPVEATAALAPASKVQVMAQAPTPVPQSTPMPRVAETPCQTPGALGVARVVEIDTNGGPGFGFQHFKAYDFLNAGEVVLTFDDGPWPGNTPAVLAALAAQCTKATFFSIGKHAIWHPEILKQVAAAGQTIGSHTWSHADLSKKTPDEAKEEIEKGISAVHAALGGPLAPFFRFPTLRQPPEMISYLEGRNIAMFSTDVDSFDFKIHKEDQLITSVMGKLKKQGKGIILMHDFQHGTAQALPQILADLKAGGFKVVHLIPKSAVETLPEYDAMMSQEIKGGTANARPTNSVVRTVSEGN